MTVGEPCLKQPVTLWTSGTHGFGTGFGSAGLALGAASAGELGLFGGTFLGSCRA